MKNIPNYNAGDLIAFGNRPNLVLKAFCNSAGICYDYLIAPISSKDTVGKDNIYPIEHERLKVPSFVKLSNLMTVKRMELINTYKIAEIDKNTLHAVVFKLKKLI